ncbi:MAG TPA: AAA family ATPase [Trueperaceae bacterium]|jgi:predicted AAA+ superfamily ATPase|nr:AAA family ATPase [Trueperaceae bacterium]
METYLPRIVDAELGSALRIAGAVLIEGPRGCGKTETGRHHAAGEVLLDTDENALMLAGIDPTAVLEGEVPRLIDEWQLEPRLWNHVRRTVDDRRAKGQFILTSSATPSDRQLKHSGAARILRLRMRTLSLSESGHSSAQVSLEDLMNGALLEPRRNPSSPSVAAVAEIVCHGGWPAMPKLTAAQAQTLLRSYLEDIVRIDLPKLEDGSRRNHERVRRTLTSIARDIRIYGQSLEARLMHYRDSAGTEVDQIVSTPDGRWIAAEVKLGTNQIDAAAASLLAFTAKLERKRTPEPAALVVFTTGEYAYSRPDGVKVVPITMLGPCA